MCMYNILNYVFGLWIFSEVSNDTIKTTKSVLSLTSLPGRHRGCVSQNCCENLRAIITSSGKNWPQNLYMNISFCIQYSFSKNTRIGNPTPEPNLRCRGFAVVSMLSMNVHMCMSLLTGPYMALHIARSYSFICNKNK